MAILPSKLQRKAEPVTRVDIVDIFSMYETDLPSAYAIDEELQAWHLKWHGNPNSAVVNTAPKALAKADEIMFPSITTVLRIAATLPVTSATCERSISSLRLLKTHLRSAMTKARLNGFSMMCIHRTRSGQDALKFDSIVDEFAARHPRRMELCDLGARQDSE